MCTRSCLCTQRREDNVYVLLCRAVCLRCCVPLLFVLLSEDDG